MHLGNIIRKGPKLLSMNFQEIKNRFGIIGSSPLLERALDIAQQVAPTNLSVLITGESGVGKEVFSKIIHQLGTRKHGPFIAVNCGAIPEGTIDSELFGHEKGSFTGASDSRKGYFEVVNGGTIFLDEVADLPLQTQVRLLRVLETGEFIRVGSSKVQKTEVRVVAATNVAMLEAIEKGKFREDLYYRLNTVPIKIPALRERSEDIPLLFRKFASDFAESYRMPVIRLDEEAVELIKHYSWPGNIRQLKNLAEQISVLEHDRHISARRLAQYLPPETGNRNLPAIYNGPEKDEQPLFANQEALVKFLLEMQRELNQLKKIVREVVQHPGNEAAEHRAMEGIRRLAPIEDFAEQEAIQVWPNQEHEAHYTGNQESEVEESLRLEDQEMELIKRALEKHRGKRKSAANELGISERTLYRKIKEYGIKE